MGERMKGIKRYKSVAVFAVVLSGCAGAEGACAKSMVLLMQQERISAASLS